MGVGAIERAKKIFSSVVVKNLGTHIFFFHNNGRGQHKTLLQELLQQCLPRTRGDMLTNEALSWISLDREHNPLDALLLNFQVFDQACLAAL